MMNNKPEHANDVIELFLGDEEQTLMLGHQLALQIAGRGLIFLEGDLGAGKTTLSRAVIRGHGHEGSVKSPTFTLVEPYEIGEQRIWHFDLYRLADPEELEFMGIRDYLADDELCLIEWPQKGQGILPMPDLKVELYTQQQGRKAVLTPYSERAQQWCAALEFLRG